MTLQHNSVSLYKTITLFFLLHLWHLPGLKKAYLVSRQCSIVDSFSAQEKAKVQGGAALVGSEVGLLVRVCANIAPEFCLNRLDTEREWGWNFCSFKIGWTY